MDDFPSMKARRLLAILMREPLNYRIVRQSGSHRILRAPHDRATVLPGVVRKILVHDVGLDEREARRLL